jgi:polyphosphate glucokinase
MHGLGIDIGGTGIKAAPVDLETGKFVADRVKIATPQPALPDAVAEVVSKLVSTFSWTRPGSAWTRGSCCARRPARTSG